MASQEVRACLTTSAALLFWVVLCLTVWQTLHLSDLPADVLILLLWVATVKMLYNVRRLHQEEEEK